MRPHHNQPPPTLVRIPSTFSNHRVQHALQRAKDLPSDRTRAQLMEILGC